jgi:hypothetical protein
MYPVNQTLKHFCTCKVLQEIRPKEIPVVPVPDRPYFFGWPYFLQPTLLFFQRDWLCDPIFFGWLRAAHTACQNGVCCHTNYWTKLPKFVHRKYASLVTIDVGTLLQIAQKKTAKTMKKIFLKKIYFRPTDPVFFTIWNWNHRYFFRPNPNLTLTPTLTLQVFFAFCRQNLHWVIPENIHWFTQVSPMEEIGS